MGAYNGPRSNVKKTRRNLAIFRAWLRGKTVTQLGKQYKLSYQRIGQIVREEAKRRGTLPAVVVAEPPAERLW